MKLKSTVKQFADAKSVDDITGDWTQEEKQEIFEAISKPVVKTPNSDLDLSGFDYRKLTGDDYKRYVAIVQGLDSRKSYDWTQYKAVGEWNKYQDNQTGATKTGNILVGIELVDSTPLNHTRVEGRHIEFWATDAQGGKHMLGLNAQIYDKQNNRANSRYYLLKLPE